VIFIQIPYTYVGPAFPVVAANEQNHDFDEQDAQLSQRDRAAACVIVFAKSGSLELGDNILRTL